MDLSTTAQLLGNIGEFLGAIAVFVTLAYLTVQVRQNNTSLEANAVQSWSVAASSVYLAPAQNDSMSRAIARGVVDATTLTDENWVAFAFWCHSFVRTAESTFHLNQRQIISDSIFEKEMERTVDLLTTNGCRQWWDAGAKTQFSEDFAAELDSRLSRPNSRFEPYMFAPGRGFYPASTVARDHRVT